MIENKVILDVKDLKVAFKIQKQILNIIRGVDLKIYKSQIVGFVGESGSGKSVTTKSFLNLNYGATTTMQKMTIDNVSLKGLKKNKWREIRGKKIAYIPQDPMTSLNPTRTIKKQLLDTLNENRKDLKTLKEKVDYMISLLGTFGIRNPEDVINRYPHTLSGGMKQRIVITSAVMCRPSLIIADEPTTALDTIVQASVLNLFEKIRKDFHVSIVFISHDISVIAKLCDYVYVFYAGKVVERGTTADIFGDPKHPYTWALLASLPEGKKGDKLSSISGSPPDMKSLPVGDPFAPRNEFALEVDFIKEPPLIQVSKTHSAATWLLYHGAPKVTIPKSTREKIEIFKKVQ